MWRNYTAISLSVSDPYKLFLASFLGGVIQQLLEWWIKHSFRLFYRYGFLRSKLACARGFDCLWSKKSYFESKLKQYFRSMSLKEIALFVLIMLNGRYKREECNDVSKHAAFTANYLIITFGLRFIPFVEKLERTVVLNWKVNIFSPSLIFSMCTTSTTITYCVTTTA